MLFATLDQPYIFLICLYFGTILANIYDTFWFIRKITSYNKWITAIVDIITVIIGLVVIIGGFYFANDLKIQWFMPLGVILGIILYVVGLRKLLHFIMDWVYNRIISKILSGLQSLFKHLFRKKSKRA